MSNVTLIGSDEASKILGVHRATFLRWVEDEVIKPVTQLPGINGAKLFDRDDVERLAESKAASA
jgi:DNA-binding transcriptional MerR regulator